MSKLKEMVEDIVDSIEAVASATALPMAGFDVVFPLFLCTCHDIDLKTFLYCCVLAVPLLPFVIVVCLLLMSLFLHDNGLLP